MYNPAWNVVTLVTFLLVAASVNANDVIEEEFVIPNINLTKLKPGPSDVPYSVTVISRADIEALGFKHVYDIFRLVPGMAIGKHHSARINVGYHATNAVLPLRFNVMIDGMSLNLKHSPVVDWSSFPISIGDIERVEVIRNPDMALNGANSFQSTVNFITRHPGEERGSSVTAFTDTNGMDRHSLALSGAVHSTDISLSLENTEDPGFDKSWNLTSKGIVPTKPEDGIHDKKINLFTVTQISEYSEFKFHTGYTSGVIAKKSSDSNAITPSDENFDNYFINSTLDYDDGDNDYWVAQFNRRQEDMNRSWYTCYPLIMFTDELRAMELANPSYVTALLSGKLPSGGTAADDELAKAVLLKRNQLGAKAMSKQCGRINEDFDERSDVVNLENRHSFSDDLMLISGLQFEENKYYSQTHVNKEVNFSSQSLYASAQYTPSSKWTLNLGGLLHIEDVNHDENFSPLFGVGYHYLENQTVKFIYSKAFRSPSVREKMIDWSYYMTDFSQPLDGRDSGYFFKRTVNPNAENLVQEELESYEISMNGQLFRNSLQYNARIFVEQFDNLISEDINFNSALLTNNSESDLRGVEGEVHYRLTTDWKLSAGFSYIDSQSSNANEQLMLRPSSGFARISYITGTYTSALAYFTDDNVRTSFDSIVATFGRTYDLPSAELFWQIRAEKQSSDYVAGLGIVSADQLARGSVVPWFSYQDEYNFSIRAGFNF